MRYTPSERERNCATAVQAASVLLFFIPGLIVGRTRWGRSPYVRFWAKVNTIWSIYLFIIAATLCVIGVLVDDQTLFVVVWSIHAVMVILGAFASMFNRPMNYFFVAERFCFKEMAEVYGAALDAEEAASATDEAD